MVRQDTNGCAYTPAGTNPESKIHRWVTDPVPQAFEMNGKAVLEFATRTINDANHKGSLCVYLFSRQDSGPTAVDTPIINSATGNPYFLYTPPGSGFWPRNAWAQIRFQMDFSPLSLGVGRRLGVGDQRHQPDGRRGRDPVPLRAPPLPDPPRGRHDHAARLTMPGPSSESRTCSP